LTYTAVLNLAALRVGHACALKGHDTLAQGTRPGLWFRKCFKAESLAQRLVLNLLCKAFSLNDIFGMLPRALPWAGMFRPFQGKHRYPFKAGRRINSEQRSI